MNTVRIMKTIAEELGVQFDEKFKIKNHHNTSDFVMRENGLFQIIPGSGAYSQREEMLLNLIWGKETIEKIPWTPRLGESYFFPDYGSELGVFCNVFKDNKVDARIKRIVGIYKTYEEAVVEASKRGWE